jgi:hypothetical protein
MALYRSVSGSFLLKPQLEEFATRRDHTAASASAEVFGRPSLAPAVNELSAARGRYQGTTGVMVWILYHLHG